MAGAEHVQGLLSSLEKGKLSHASEYLTIFWHLVDDESPRSKKFKMLKAMAGVKFKQPQYKKRRKARNRYINKRDNGRPEWLDNENKPCFLCEGESHHRHHIIQIQYGGKNVKKNFVHLCRYCHREVHK